MINLSGKITSNKNIKAKINRNVKLLGNLSRNGGSSSGYYDDLKNKPRINNVELIDNLSSEDLGLQKDLHIEQIGDNLKVDNGVLSMQTTNNAEQDNTKPMTSAGVYTQLGNINVLLQKI